MQLDRNELISAQVILLPASKKKIGPDTRITSGTIKKLAPPPDAFHIASGIFRSIDFEIGPLVGVSFSITASFSIFENTFKTEFQRNLKDGIECVGGDIELPLDHLPNDVRKIVQIVTFTEPPDFGPADF